MDAAGWTAFFTGLLVLVTYLLWTSAQKQLARQHQDFVLLNLPAIIIDAKVSWLKNGEFVIVLRVQNNGRTAALNLEIFSQIEHEGQAIGPIHHSKIPEFLVGDSFATLNPLPKAPEGQTFTANMLALSVKLKYDDIEKKFRELKYICKYNPEVPEILTRERVLS